MTPDRPTGPATTHDDCTDREADHFSEGYDYGYRGGTANERARILAALPTSLAEALNEHDPRAYESADDYAAALAAAIEKALGYRAPAPAGLPFPFNGYEWDCPNCGEHIVSWIKPPTLGVESETAG